MVERPGEHNGALKLSGSPSNKALARRLKHRSLVHKGLPGASYTGYTLSSGAFA
jgi:hypothetical protein